MNCEISVWSHKPRHKSAIGLRAITGRMMTWMDKPRILIVDDDTEFASDLQILLSSEFEVATAPTTRRAWEILDEYRPHCLLLDLNMPQYFGEYPTEEGFSFLTHLRSESAPRFAAGLPVIILTARKESQFIEMAQRLRISTHYCKPPDVKRLKASIWNLLAGASYPGTREVTGS
jgi:DNA-binding response OmpR family regulator